MTPRPLLSWAFVALTWAISVATLRSEDLRLHTPYPFLVSAVLSGVLALAVAISPRSYDNMSADVQSMTWKSYLVQIVPYSMMSSIALVLFVKAFQIGSMGVVLFVLLARFVFNKASLPVTSVALGINFVLFKTVGHLDNDLLAALSIAGCMMVTNIKHKVIASQTSEQVHGLKPRRMLLLAAPYRGLVSVNYYNVFLCGVAYTIFRISSSIVLAWDDDKQTLLIKLAREVVFFITGLLFTHEWAPIGHILFYPLLTAVLCTLYIRYYNPRGYVQTKREGDGAHLRHSDDAAADGGGEHGANGASPTMLLLRTIPVLLLQFAVILILLHSAMSLANKSNPEMAKRDIVFRLEVDPVKQAPDRHYRIQPASDASHEYVASVPQLSSLPSRSSVLPSTRKERLTWKNLIFASSSFSGNNHKILYRLQLWGKRPEVDWHLYWQTSESEAARENFRKEFERVLPGRELKWDFIDEPSLHVRWFKMVPLLWKAASKDVQWFLLGDDDTLWLPDNLLELLNKYDPTQPWYLGSVSENPRFRDIFGTHFAYGGGGVAVSRALMEKIVPLHDECLERYKDVFGGDGRLGECIQYAGHHLTHEPGFNQFDLKEMHDIKSYLSSHLSLHYPVAMHRHDVFDESFLLTQSQLAAGAAIVHLTERIPRDLLFRRLWWVVRPTAATADPNSAVTHKGDFDLLDARDDYYHDTSAVSLLRPSEQVKTVVMVFGYHIRIYNSLVPVNVDEALQGGADYTYTDFWLSEWRMDHGDMVYLDPRSGRKIVVRCGSHSASLDSLCA
ncbi:hypothetical protein RI367_007666 [Sorochytrium milnesiophthora]